MEGGTPSPRRKLRGLLRNRYAIVVFAVLVAASVPSAMAALHGKSAAPTLQVRSAHGFARSVKGGGQPTTGKPQAGVAQAGNHPKPIRLTKPVARHLTKAGSAVFDVRSLKSVVVRQERPERQSPFDREHEGAA